MGAETNVITVDEAKLQMNIPADDTSQDTELVGFIGAVTEVIEHIVGPVVPREVVEVHDGGRPALVLQHLPVLSITSVTEAGVAVPPSGWTLTPEGLLYRSAGVWQRWPRYAVTVTEQAGRNAVPASVSLAAKELVAISFRPQQGGNYSPFDAGGDAGDGGQMILGFFVPNRVMQMLVPSWQPDGFA